MTGGVLGSTVADMTMSRLRKVTDEAEARASLSALAKSGKTLREWARSRQLDGRSLRAWQLNLSRGATRALAKSTPARLVELVPVLAPSASRRYLIRVADVSIELDDDFDAASLRRIVEVLRSC